MKTILVLTDFSPSAQKAAEEAMFIGKKLDFTVLLLNAYVVATIGVSTEPMPWPMEYYHVLEQDSIDMLKLEKERLQKKMSLPINGTGKVNLITVSRGGNLADNVSEIIKEMNVQMIFMGSRHKKGSEFLFGSDIRDVIHSAKLPVFIIPDTGLNLPLKELVYATDLSTTDLNNLEFVVGLAMELKFTIELCHVTKRDSLDEGLRKDHPPSDFQLKLERANIPGVSFTTLEGDHIREELIRYTSKKKNVLLALTHKKHSFFWRIFHETPATDLLRFKSVPLLILPQ